MKWRENPLPKKAKANTETLDQERDWTHMVIYDHIQYGYPDCFTGCGAYPDYSTPENFADVVAQASEAVKKLDLDLHSATALDSLVQLKAYQLVVGSLTETRLMHHRTAASIRADLLYQLGNLRSSRQIIEAEKQAIDAEIHRLEQ